MKLRMVISSDVEQLPAVFREFRYGTSKEEDWYRDQVEQLGYFNP